MWDNVQLHHALDIPWVQYTIGNRLVCYNATNATTICYAKHLGVVFQYVAPSKDHKRMPCQLL